MTYINLTTAERLKPIYRYTDFGRVVRMFQKKEMVLVRPEKWDDPFENYLIDPEYRSATGGILRLSYRHVMHGACWSKKYVSDAMWRIYSPDKISVRIKSTPEIIGECLEEALERYPRSSWHIGKVKYLRQGEILKMASDLAHKILKSKNEREIVAAKSALFKRTSFSHEQEVRVFVIDRHSRSKNGIIKIKIDPHKIVQNIMVDSRAPDEWLDVYSTFMKHELGFKGKISKSTLYRPVGRLIIER